MVTVDASKLIARTKRAVELHKEFPRLLVTALRRARDVERRSHSYINRTHNLQKSTAVQRAGGAGLDQAWTLEMGEEYASYVIRRGLSNFPKIVDDVEDEIANEQRKIEQAVSR